MRTVTVTHTYYTVEELKDVSAVAYGRAVEDYARAVDEDTDWSDEWASLAAFDEHIGFKRDNGWHVSHSLGDAADLQGPRAWAWYENVVIGPLREPWKPIAQRSRYTRPGLVPDCPLTGFYMDHVLLSDLCDSLSHGMSVGDAVRNLRQAVRDAIDSELDYLRSESCFLERATDEEWEFTEFGERV